MNLKSRTCYIEMQLKKLTVYGFTIQMNVKKLQISLTGMVVYEFSPQDANLLPIWSKL